MPLQFKFVGNLLEDLNIINVSKYGRDFSIVGVPYAFKLLMQELQAMNIQMRLITDKNIDQLTNMSYSNNIMKLTGKDLTTSSTAFIWAKNGSSIVNGSAQGPSHIALAGSG